jgi:hypothetical protein
LQDKWERFELRKKLLLQTDYRNEQNKINQYDVKAKKKIDGSPVNRLNVKIKKQVVDEYNTLF